MARKKRTTGAPIILNELLEAHGVVLDDQAWSWRVTEERTTAMARVADTADVVGRAGTAGARLHARARRRWVAGHD